MLYSSSTATTTTTTGESIAQELAFIDHAAERGGWVGWLGPAVSTAIDDYSKHDSSLV